MTVCLAYVYPQLASRIYDQAARRFAQSYCQFPPGQTAHDVVVLANGPSMGPHQQQVLTGLTYSVLQHDNTGKDIGAFQQAASILPCDLLVCFGAHVHFWKSGWLDRILDAYLDNGPSLYGCWGFEQPAPHIRTTAFWCPPELLDAYPYHVNNQQRYAFEHGPESITLWSRKLGFETYQVTWTRVLDGRHWDCLSKEECLMLDQHTQREGKG